MQKIIDDPTDLVRGALTGMAGAYPELSVDVENAIVYRATPKEQGKVSLLSGGGSGHEPLHGGFVGFGMLDAACAGAVFTSPVPDQILAATTQVDRGAGVLHIVKNYSGDVMNFEMAAEAAAGVEVATVITADDVAVADSTYSTGRRGVGVTVLLEKIVGAAAEDGLDLEECRSLAQRVADSGRSMGVALTSCTVPAAGHPTFDLPEGRMEVGVGIHGEPGRRTDDLGTASEIAHVLVEPILADHDFTSGPVLSFVNGLGGTPLLELYNLSAEIDALLGAAGVEVVRHLVGPYITSLEMAGASLTLLALDDEMLRYWEAPVNTPGLRWGTPGSADPETSTRASDAAPAAASTQDSPQADAADAQARTETGGTTAAPSGPRRVATGAEGTISTATFAAWLREYARLVGENESVLTDLDAAIGDADHGANMTRGMAAVVAYLDGLGGDDALAEVSPATMLGKAGMTLVSTVGGASGPLYGTFLMRTGQACGDAPELDATTLATALRAGIEGVQARGKATTGEKTMLDALVPAVEAFDGGQGDLVAALDAATSAADAGRDATTDLTATKGRASYLGERSVGHQDPGATSAALLIAALHTAVAQSTGTASSAEAAPAPQSESSPEQVSDSSPTTSDTTTSATADAAATAPTDSPTGPQNRGVGFVVVSHSRPLAEAAVALAAETTPGDPVTVEVAAGTADGGFGTDAVAIRKAIERVDAAAGGGVVVLLDLGSAVMSTETALDLLGDDVRGRVAVSAGPLVEALVVGVVQASVGGDLESVRTACAGALGVKEGQIADLG
ncbi:dihydroxyacetone kinase subunit DhaK [Mobilicoccus pelagius]|uniref:phosphoenolpyruvate--glycerone phosphotransferase n=1 Tax=Mobilicoccus pelagius NBRC 104925 TaxID=1089455 RepID=H5UTL8_9MICO|nr:dihydroxyacetone kinase subunit DhaK [Mobilicoccus pelagius]GAB49076.1 dihydroxyacetone kinase [Mobilicoccus pelagius NBRC 104925]